jgi:hypothetical protein
VYTRDAPKHGKEGVSGSSPEEGFAPGAAEPMSNRKPTCFLVAGGAIGVALGILVSVATDIPFAPEAGLVLGLLAPGSRPAGSVARQANPRRVQPAGALVVPLLSASARAGLVRG